MLESSLAPEKEMFALGTPLTGCKVSIALKIRGVSPFVSLWLGLGWMDLRCSYWKYSGSDPEYGERRNSMKRRFRTGAIVRLEQPTGNAAVKFLASDTLHVTVSYHKLIAGTSLYVLILLVFKNADCISSIYNRHQVLDISSTWERLFDLFYIEICSITLF